MNNDSCQVKCGCVSYIIHASASVLRLDSYFSRPRFLCLKLSVLVYSRWFLVLSGIGSAQPSCRRSLGLPIVLFLLTGPHYTSSMCFQRQQITRIVSPTQLRIYSRFATFFCPHLSLCDISQNGRFVYACPFIFTRFTQLPDDGPNRDRNLYISYYKYTAVLD